MLLSVKTEKSQTAKTDRRQKAIPQKRHKYRSPLCRRCDEPGEVYRMSRQLCRKDATFQIEELEKGMLIELKKDISIYLNNENADTEIIEWFRNAFGKFQEFIKTSPNLGWKIRVS